MGIDRVDAVTRWLGERSRVEVRITDGNVPGDVLGAALALSLWVAVSSFVLAIADGLGTQPLHRLAVGAVLVSVALGALVKRSSVCAALKERPWLVVPLAAGLLGVIAADRFVGGPYVAVSLTSVGIAVIAARARTVWLCVAVLVAGYACGVFLERPPSQLAADGRLGGVIGTLVSFPVAAGLLLALRRRYTRFLAGFQPALESIRSGSPAVTPELGRALRAEPIALLLPPPPLTPAERRIVEGLAAGLTPKELAFGSGVSINTVRTHIRSAKRKTGARTLRELAAMAAHLERSGGDRA